MMVIVLEIGTVMLIMLLMMMREMVVMTGVCMDEILGNPLTSGLADVGSDQPLPSGFPHFSSSAFNECS